MASTLYIFYFSIFELVTFIKLLIIFLVFTMLIATITLIERKVLALTQRRVGPNYIGYRGRFQFIADAVKLIVKHIVILTRVNRSLFLIIPSILLICVYLFWANLIWAPNLAICEIEYNLLWMGVLSTFFSYFLILAGYITNNKYAILSSSRVVIMSFILEILLNFLFIILALASNNLSLVFLGSLNSNIGHFLLMIPAMPAVLITLLLEVNRIPFDLAEAESELIAGYTTEYGGFFFVLFYLGEYFHLFCSSTFFVTAIFGAWMILIMLTFFDFLSYPFHVISTFLYISWTDLLLLLLLSFTTWNFFICSSFRYKMYYFILNVVIFGIWGFLASFDGLTLMMLTTELTVAVFFLFLFVTAKFKKDVYTISNNYWFIHIFILLLLNLYVLKENTSTFYYFFQNIYPYTQDIIAHDLIIIYMFVLFFNPIITIYLSVTLGLFSLFFICVFFTVRTVRQITEDQDTEDVTLRKQLTFSQSYYKALLRAFQA